MEPAVGGGGVATAFAAAADEGGGLAGFVLAVGGEGLGLVPDGEFSGESHPHVPVGDVIEVGVEGPDLSVGVAADDDGGELDGVAQKEAAEEIGVDAGMGAFEAIGGDLAAVGVDQAGGARRRRRR